MNPKAIVSVGILAVLLWLFLGVLLIIPWQVVGVLIPVSIGIPTLLLAYERGKLNGGGIQTKRNEKNGEAIISNETETSPTKAEETRKDALLPEKTKIVQLNITNDLLDQIYEQAHLKVIKMYHDAQLSSLGIQVYPFAQIGPNVHIYLGFYAKFADKKCTFKYGTLSPKVTHVSPDKPVKYASSKNVFTSLPWKTNPQWRQFLERVYAKIGPLSPTPRTHYDLDAYPDGWYVSFEDGLSGNEYHYRWTGAGLDEKSIEQLD